MIILLIIFVLCGLFLGVKVYGNIVKTKLIILWGLERLGVQYHSSISKYKLNDVDEENYLSLKNIQDILSTLQEHQRYFINQLLFKDGKLSKFYIFNTKHLRQSYTNSKNNSYGGYLSKTQNNLRYQWFFSHDDMAGKILSIIKAMDISSKINVELYTGYSTKILFSIKKTDVFSVQMEFKGSYQPQVVKFESTSDHGLYDKLLGRLTLNQSGFIYITNKAKLIKCYPDE